MEPGPLTANSAPKLNNAWWRCAELEIAIPQPREYVRGGARLLKRTRIFREQMAADLSAPGSVSSPVTPRTEVIVSGGNTMAIDFDVMRWKRQSAAAASRPWQTLRASVAFGSSHTA